MTTRTPLEWLDELFDLEADPSEQHRAIFIVEIGRELVDRKGNDQLGSAGRGLGQRRGLGAGGSGAQGRSGQQNPTHHILLLSQLRPQALVDYARIGLAGHRLHRLADEEAEQLLLA